MRQILAFVMMFLGGCAFRMGPKMVPRDRFDYSSSLTTSWKEQLLMNMVKVRYMDPPMFLDVAQVVTSYTLDRSVSINAPNWEGVPAGAAASGTGRFAESPTITYNPLVGDKFTKSLLKPISPIALFSLVQAGWPIDDLFGIAVRVINGLYAASSLQALRRTGDPSYYRLLRLLRELQMTDAFAFRVEERAKEEAALLVFRPRQLDAETEAKSREVRKMLGLDLAAKEFRLAFGTVARDSTEIAMVTRSMLEILMEAAAGVEVPASDVTEGRAIPPVDVRPPGQETRRFVVRVRSSAGKPSDHDAFSEVRYRGTWFWVEDRDLASKRGLGFLLILFSMAEYGTTAAPPVLSISKP
jgi:hypothetical protein